LFPSTQFFFWQPALPQSRPPCLFFAALADNLFPFDVQLPSSETFPVVRFTVIVSSPVLPRPTRFPLLLAFPLPPRTAPSLLSCFERVFTHTRLQPATSHVTKNSYQIGLFQLQAFGSRSWPHFFSPYDPKHSPSPFRNFFLNVYATYYWLT